MKIMQVITLCELGGAQSVVVNLANSLCESHDVIVVAGDGDGKMWDLLNMRIRQERVKYLKRTLSPIYDTLTLFSLIKLYFKYKPDIIHLHSSKIGILGRIAFPKAKVIYTVHGFDSVRIAYRKFLPIEKLLQNSCKAIVGVSKYDSRNLFDEGITHNVYMVYNGILKPTSLNYDPFSFCSDYTHKILCIARLSPPKNSELFLKIASLLPQYAFIWIGNQHELKSEYSKNVFFMGNLTNAGAYNAYADLFILPSNYEGLPMVILEAMSFGRPVIASNVGGISEIVRNGDNGYTVENTPEAFISSIKYVLENKNVYSELAKRSMKIFNNELTVDRMVNGYMKIYQQ